MKLIGDPHIGREFKANVPLDRRGERERNMLRQFHAELKAPDDLIVCVGDLFDAPQVRYEYVVATVRILSDEAFQNPHKQYIILAGNHDISPSVSVVGAFDILELAMEQVKNVHVVRTPQTLCGVMFFPWEWTRTALEQLDDGLLWTDTAVGHWDLVDYGTNTDHLCPADALAAKGVTRIVSGHWHVAGVYPVGSVSVTCTGSMQPMTHAEDKEGKLYVTLTAEKYGRISPERLCDKYVRVLVEKGEDVSPPPTCLGFKTQLVSGESEAVERVTLGAFDINKILDKHLKEHAVPVDLQKEIKESLNGLA